MRRGTRFAAGAGIALGALLLLLIAAVLVLTETQWGRDHVLRVALRQVDAAIDGQLSVRRLEGSLLRRFRLISVSIVDDQRRPFLMADTIETRYALRALLRQRIVLTDLRLVNANVVLDRPPGEDWNVVRIFRPDPVVEPVRPGWGDWVLLRGVEIVDSRLTVRSEWRPEAGLTPAERERVIERALTDEGGRALVVPVAGGYQTVMDYSALNGTLPSVLVADPEIEQMIFDVESLSGVMHPFRPPAALVRDVAGRFVLGADWFWFRGARAAMPGSVITGDGAFELATAEYWFDLQSDSVALADLRWLYPRLPDTGGGSLHLVLHRREEATEFVADRMDLHSGGSILRGRLGMVLGDTLRFHSSAIRFAELDTRLVERVAPGIDVPHHGLLTGHVALRGRPRALVVDADVAFASQRLGTSRVLAAGGLGLDDDDPRFRDLHVRFAPLRADLVREQVPVLPAGSALRGGVRLSGTLDGPLHMDGDLALTDPRTGVSRVTARGRIDPQPDHLRFGDLRLRFAPLQVALLRERLPEAPPAGTLTGELRLDGSTAARLRVDAQLALAEPRTGVSRAGLAGEVELADELRAHALRVRFDPLQLDLVRDELPELPAGAQLITDVLISGEPRRRLQLAGELELRDPDSGVSRVHADGAVAYADTLHFTDLALRFEPLQLDLVQRLAPELPPGATLTGDARLDGPPAGMLRLHADVAVDDPATGTSRVEAAGGIAFAEPRFDDLDLSFAPLQVELVRPLAPELPIGGVLEGRVTLDGAPATHIAARGELEHVEAGERSRVAGRAEVVAGPDGRAAVDLQLQPLSLVTAGRFAPGAGLRGSVSGQLQAHGRLADLTASVDLQVADGGGVRGDGRFDLASEHPGYAFTTQLADFDLAAVTRRAPASTRLTGALRADGRGLDPPTMTATLAADLIDSHVAEVEADRVRLRAALADGLARVDSSEIRLGGAEALLHGSFGLTAERQGTLAYRVHVDTLAAVTADTLAGALVASGVLRGNPTRFDLIGTAEMRNLRFRDDHVGQGLVEHTLLALGTPQPYLELDGGFVDLHVQGLRFDSAAVGVRHRGLEHGFGRAVLAVWQDDETEHRADVEFALAPRRRELRLHHLALRADTVTWTSARPAVVTWAEPGVEVEGLELRSDAGGRVMVDGRLPIDGEGDLRVAAEEVDVGHVATLLQAEAEARGRLSLDAQVAGTLRRPRLDGTAGLRAAAWNGTELPDAQMRFAYAGVELTAEAELSHEGVPLGIVDARLPLDLALVDRAGPVLLDAPLAVDVVADSLPLEPLEALIGELEEVEGLVAGTVSVRGTFDDPVLDGTLDVRNGAFRVAPLGVRYDEVAGRVRLSERVATVDSLVARNGGPLRVTGEVDLSSLLEPELALEFEAREAWIVDTGDLARLQVDADLSVSGPLDRIRIEGELTARRGVIYIPPPSGQDVVALDEPGTFERVAPALVQRRDELLRVPPLLRRLEVDVQAHVERDVWVRSLDANVEIHTVPEIGPLAIRMNGEQGRFSVVGTVNSDRGEYEFLSRRFLITRGAATFAGEPDAQPQLQIAAAHEAHLPGREAVEIRVVIGGTADRPTVNLESDAQPPIAQTQLLSYIAFGRNAVALLPQQGSGLTAHGAGTGELAADAAALATHQLTAVAASEVIKHFERDVARELGLDMFRITPADLAEELWTGRFSDLLRGTEIEAGSYIGPRLFVAAHLRPTLEARPGARLEYRTRRGFRWTTSWEPRFLPAEPRLGEPEPRATSVFGGFLQREWRF